VQYAAVIPARISTKLVPTYLENGVHQS